MLIRVNKSENSDTYQSLCNIIILHIDNYQISHYALVYTSYCLFTNFDSVQRFNVTEWNI